MDVLSIFCMYRHFSCFQYGFQNGHQWSRDYLFITGSNKSFIYKQHSVKFHSDRFNGSGDTLCYLKHAWH